MDGDESSMWPHLNFSVPILLGFAEDYKKVLLKCKPELVLMLTKNLGDVFEQSRNEQTFKPEMMNITWKIPHVTPNDFAIIKMYDMKKVELGFICEPQIGVWESTKQECEIVG